MQAFATLPNILAPPPDRPLALLAANGVSEMFLEAYTNVFERDALLAEKSNDDSLVILHPLNKRPQTDGPRDTDSQRTAGVMPLSYSCSGCAIEIISLVRW
jgi:hypothetical protein